MGGVDWRQAGAKCAILFVCAKDEDDERVPLCLFYLCLSGVSLVGAAATLSYLMAMRTLWSSSADPITGVGIADLTLAATLVCGASAALFEPTALKSTARDALFHVSFASFLATSVLAFGSARMVWLRLNGRGKLLTMTTTTTTSVMVEEELEKAGEEAFEPRPTEDEIPSLTLFAGPSRRSLRFAIGFTYCLAAIVSLCAHIAEQARRIASLFVLVPGLVVALLLIASIVMYWQVAQLSGVSYPRAQYRTVRRAIILFVLAHGAKALFVLAAAVVASSERLFFARCSNDGTWSTKRPGARIVMEVALASIGALDAVAFFSNSPWYNVDDDAAAVFDDSVSPSHNIELQCSDGSFAPWAPLPLVRLDERSLLAAPVVGRGTFGTVRMLGSASVSCGRRLLEAGIETVAVKSFAHRLCAATCDADDAALSPQDTWVKEQLELLRVEAFQVARLHHRRIVSLYGIAETSALGPCLVSEYLDGGSLYDHLVQPDSAIVFERNGPRLASRAARHVADALRYLHSKHVIHRDLKSANVLVAADGHANPFLWRFKVSDFGTSRVLLDHARLNSANAPTKRRRRLRTAAARFFDLRNNLWKAPPQPSHASQVAQQNGDLQAPAGHPISKLLTTQVGTPLAMAPELLVTSSTDYDTKIDVYSFAILLWETCARSTNWYATYGDPGPGCAVLFRRVADGLRPPISDAFDPSLTALMRTCWDPDPKKRPNFERIYDTLCRIRRSISTSPTDKPHIQPRDLEEAKSSIPRTPVLSLRESYSTEQDTAASNTPKGGIDLTST